MAEFLALTGGLAAILQLSKTALRLASALHHLASTSPAAEITRFANQAQSFSDTVAAAQVTLRRYCLTNPTSPLVQFLVSRNVLGNMGVEADAVRRRLRGVQRRVAGFGGANGKGKGVWVRLWWGWRMKGGVNELVPEMESVKTGLGLVLATAQFEALVLMRPADAEGEERVREEMHALRRVIRQHVETMGRLREELAQARQAAAAASARGGRDPLMDLGRSVSRHGVIPSAHSSSSTAAAAHAAASRTRTAGARQAGSGQTGSGTRTTTTGSTGFSVGGANFGDRPEKGQTFGDSGSRYWGRMK